MIERILRHCGMWERPIRTLASARAPLGSFRRADDALGHLELVPDAANPLKNHVANKTNAGRPAGTYTTPPSSRVIDLSSRENRPPH